MRFEGSRRTLYLSADVNISVIPSANGRDRPVELEWPGPWTSDPWRALSTALSQQAGPI